MAGTIIASWSALVNKTDILELTWHRSDTMNLINNYITIGYYEMVRVNINMLGIRELRWTRMGKFHSDDCYIYYCGQESLRRNAVAIMVKKIIQNAVLACNLKNDRMISVHFQDKPFNITVIQVYAPTSNAEEAEVERFYEDLQDLLELTPPKMSFSL